MKTIQVLLLVFALIPNRSAAQLSDRTWLLGYDEFPGMAGSGHAIVQFAPGSQDAQADSIQLAFNFESTMAVAVSLNGQLLFYSNGCEIANRDHVVMPNGWGLNPGDLNAQVCNWKGYILPQGAMILPDPGDTTLFQLIHLGASYRMGRRLVRGPLFYTTVDMSLENSLGDVESKNNLLLAGDLGSFTAIRHGNGRDWWIVAPEFGNKIWHTFLLTPNGFEAMAPQQVFTASHGCRLQESTVSSLDGNRIATWGDCKISVLNFERCDGSITPALDLDPLSRLIPGGGLAFSPSGRYLYATSQNVLFRADLEAALPQLDTMRFSYDPSLQSPYDLPGNTFHYLVNAPGGTIFGDSPSRRRYLHVLENPEAPSISTLSFVPQGLSLPVVGVRSLPHFPNFRLYDLPGSPCDTLGIDGPTTGTTSPASLPTLVLSPNPAGDVLSVKLTTSYPTTFIPTIESLRLFDATGRVVLSQQVARSDQGASVDVSQLPSGLYFVNCSAEGYIWTRRFVKR